jgi:hypothetical protein
MLVEIAAARTHRKPRAPPITRIVSNLHATAPILRNINQTFVCFSADN